MKRILLRVKKDPFEVLSPEASLDRNAFGTNSGDLLWMEAAYKLLATTDATIDLHRFRPEPSDADQVNERYDIYVLPLSNAFRPKFQAYLVALTRFIEKLRIPVIVLGVGAQASLQEGHDDLRPLDASVKRFVRAVLDRSTSIGVRGEFTRDYLHSLGYRDVEVIGCPSMFMYGPSMEVTKKRIALDDQARLSINVSPELEELPDRLSDRYRYRDLSYVAQDAETLAYMLWRVSTGAAKGDEVALSIADEFLHFNQLRFFLDPWPWISYLAERDFVFGTRMHGCISALLAGTPAYVLAHDSRTLELARYFAIPHRVIAPSGDRIDPAELYEEADYSDLNGGHAARFATLVGYLHRHGLDHIFADEGALSAFEARISATRYPPGVDGMTPARASRRLLVRSLRYRLRRFTPHWVRRIRARRHRAVVISNH